MFESEANTGDKRESVFDYIPVTHTVTGQLKKTELVIVDKKIEDIWVKVIYLERYADNIKRSGIYIKYNTNIVFDTEDKVFICTIKLYVKEGNPAIIGELQSLI